MNETRPTPGLPPAASRVAPPAQASGQAPAQAIAKDDMDPIELVEDALEEAGSPALEKKIKAFGVQDLHHDRKWKRQVVKTGTGASRVRSFHGKYSEQGLEYLDNAINEWLDNNPDIEVKFVTPTVMTFEGKIREPALVLNVWY